MQKKYASLGLMSGTSGDGVDASLIISNGINQFEVKKNKYFEYDSYIFKKIHDLKDKIHNLNDLEKLSDEFVGQLKNSIPEIVFIYSENSARSYLNLLKKYNLIDNWMDTNLMCLGEKSSAVLNEIKWKKIFLFNPGEEEYLLYKI